MNIKQLNEKLKMFEDTENNPDINLRAIKLKNKAEELGLKYTSIVGGFDTDNPMIMLTIDLPHDRNKFNIYIYSDKPTLFEYGSIKLNQDPFIHFSDNVNKMVEIVKAL